MEFTGTLSGLSLPKNLRKGQIETLERVISGQSTVVTQLPTGYGKTLTAVCTYALLRHQGRANRLLYICPRRNQARQAEEIPGDLAELFGINTQAIIIGDEPLLALDCHRSNTAEIFIVTIQGLCANAIKTVNKLMQIGQWALVIDEHHHYAEGEVWAERIKGLGSQFQLAMSATPARLDAKDYFPNPDVRVTYRQALKEGAVKELHLHQYEYMVDLIVGENNDPISLTTTELFDELGIKEEELIDTEMARRKMRWSPKYISPLITYPAERLANLRLRGIKSQMIVQAMSCSHAEMACKQIQALLPTLDIDWVGTGPNGRAQKKNEEVINRFCPEKKNGVRNWSLDVLVNVGMAGEGLDTIDVTEISILTPANITPSLLQLIGRASRRMSIDVQPIACINCDTDSAIAVDDKWRGRRVMAIFDEDVVDPNDIEPGDPKPDEYQEMPDEPVIVVADVRLIDIKTDPAYPSVMEALKVAQGQYTEQQLEGIAEVAINKYNRERDEQFKQESNLAQLKSSIEAACGKIAGLVIRRMAEQSIRIERSLIGDLKKRINVRKKRLYGSIDRCNVDCRKEQYAWLKKLEQEILKEHGLLGVPKWLR